MTELVMSSAFVARRQAWLGQLRTACIVVAEQPTDLIRSISVTQRFAGVPADERRELLTLAVRLAGEYRLTAETMDRGSSVTVWISRLEVGRPDDAPSEANDAGSVKAPQGMAGRMRRLLRPEEPKLACDRPAPEEEPDGTHPARVDESRVVR